MSHCEDLGCFVGVCICGCDPCMAAKHEERERFDAKWAPRKERDALAERVRRLEAALRRVRSESSDNMIAAIADDALEPKMVEMSSTLAPDGGD